MRKIKEIILWASILLYLVFTLSFTGEKRRNTICSKMRVHIVDSLQDQFITEKGVENYIYDLDLKVLGEPVTHINIKKLEGYLNAREKIKKTEVYFTGNGDLHIRIDQRNPIVRIINRRGQSYYIDDGGAIISLSGNYTSHVLVATGEITEFFEFPGADRLNCPDINASDKHYILCEIYELARFIHNSPFWDSQIEQVHRNEKGEYELIPRVGAHLILFGEFARYREKFRNLKAFYEKGLNNVGWNKYLKINLKYDNQIICTKI